MKQIDDMDEEIGDDENSNTEESILSLDINQDILNQSLDFLLLDEPHNDNTVWTTGVPLPKISTHGDTVIAHAPLQNSRNPAGAIAPPLLKCQKSTLHNKLCKSHCPTAQAHPPPKSSGDQNVPNPKASGVQNVPQYHWVSFEVAKRLMEVIIFTKTPWPIESDEKYSMVEVAWEQAIDAQVC